VPRKKVSRKIDPFHWCARALADKHVNQRQADRDTLARIEHAGQKRVALIVVVFGVSGEDKFRAEKISHDFHAAPVTRRAAQASPEFHAPGIEPLAVGCGLEPAQQSGPQQPVCFLKVRGISEDRAQFLKSLQGLALHDVMQHLARMQGGEGIIAPRQIAQILHPCRSLLGELLFDQTHRLLIVVGEQPHQGVFLRVHVLLPINPSGPRRQAARLLGGLSREAASAILADMKKTGCALLVLFLALCASVFLNLVLAAWFGASEAESVAAGRFTPRLEEIVIEHGSRDAGKIAVIPVQGVIQTDDRTEWGSSMVDDITKALRTAADDDEVKAVVLAVDSPGGEVTASDILYHEVGKLRANKPVVVSMGSLGASGAYYLSCAADWIVANETTFTGSIGVIIQSLNYEQLFSKVGLDAVVFKSGKFKDMLSGSRKMTPEEQAYIEGVVQQVYGRFLDIVASGRKLPADQLRAGLADGRIITGKDAQAAGLVDQVGYLEDAYDKARELAEAPGASVIRYEAGLNFGRVLRLLGAGAKSKVELQVGGAPSLRLQPGRAYLLPEFYAW